MRPAAGVALLAAAACSPHHDRLNVRSDGAVLPVAVYGQLGGDTLIVVESGGPSGPGIAERRVGYHPFRETLEQEAAVAWYDRRGTGNATGDYAAEDQSMDQLIADLHAVVTVLRDRYAPRHLVLLGHSFGTYTSALYQLEHPGVIDGWVAAAPSILEGPDDLFVPYRRDFACRVGEDRRRAGASGRVWSDLEAFCAANPTLPAEWDTPEREELWGYLAVIEDELEPWPSLDPAGVLGAVFFSQYNLVDTQLRRNRISPAIEAEPGREDLLPELGALDVPTAVVTGEFDGSTPTELGAALVAALPGTGELTEIPDGGHYPMFDDPDGFEAAVLGVVGGR